ncbi:hypothetical protein D9V87_03055 [Bacteroidetes/Chlorobi group bacterium MS-B_bin-24]|jgi:hypothetical protein|nr:MAG: hypothetical protein D9V87_03055 [Bacteroidetes/Chlorobi group bacterium MS-B_bin-24]
MKVVKQKKVTDCYESSNTIDLILSAPITKPFVEHLGQLGKLLLFDEFDIPYFKVIVKGEYTIKGAFGKKTIRILLPEDVEDYPLDSLVQHIENFNK